MKYQIITIESLGKLEKHVVITHENNLCESYPADENNPHYQQFKAEIEAE